MQKSTKISRKDFLAIIAGVIGAAALSKFFGLGKASNNLASLKGIKGSYGNSPYGGKKA